MNIFILDTDPVKSATLMCDKHVVKMILESAQLLCSVFQSGEAPYRRTHYNHPCAVWLRKSKSNYEWLITHVIALNQEYKYRYNKEVDHKSMCAVSWCIENYAKLNLPDIGLTTFTNCVSDDLKHLDTTTAYREYYRLYKKDILKYTKRSVPVWV